MMEVPFLLLSLAATCDALLTETKKVLKICRRKPLKLLEVIEFKKVHMPAAGFLQKASNTNPNC